MSKEMEILMIPAYVSTLRTLVDRTWKIELKTNELPPYKVAGLSEIQNKIVVAAFKVDDFKSEELDIMKSIDFEDTEKTPSQRYRAVLWHLWKQNPEGFKDFRNYYYSHMEIEIAKIKKRLDE